MANRNRITYIEPNNLPGEFASSSPKNVTVDNITWAPEDLNISVDLQVVLPSRIYRKSNLRNDFSQALKKQSILSGINLAQSGKPEENNLTTEYTNVCYQEIKNNQAGSEEMLGINSIRIVFDSHMYPRVTMNFTDVRGSALMMPQEQYVYDMGANKKLERNNKVCESFFQSFFKFPYPQFLLSVKGIYGTCVTFVLSVEDFKATFNSETGNFDVVVTFIGLMYGLYTDIPMNYLLMAPYIGSSNENITNEYWRSKTSPGGEFYYAEKNGEESRPISTFFDFANDYRDLISNEQGKEGFIYGANIAEISKIHNEIAELEKLLEYYNEIPLQIISEVDNNIEYHSVVDNGNHILFFVCKTPVSKIKFSSEYVKNFTEALKNYQDKHTKLNINTTDVPGQLSNSNASINTVYDSCEIFVKENNDYSFRKDTNFYKRLVGVYGQNPNLSEIEKQIGQSVESCRCGLVYNEDFKNKVSKRIGELNNQANSLEEEASKEMTAMFKDACGFTPSIENVMRMVFAHLDTFLYEFYRVLESIGGKNRSFKEINWNISNTDVLSSSENDAALPPFAAFYRQKHEKFERVYPSPELKNLDEIVFVEEILNGLSNKLKNEAIEAQKRANGEQFEEQTGSSYDFTPIAITDYFYNSNPYSDINTSEDLNSIHDVVYFIICRLYTAFRDIDKNTKENNNIKEDVLEAELRNLKNSNVWNYIISTFGEQSVKAQDFYDYFLEDEKDKQKILIIKNKQKSCEIYRSNGGHDYYCFDGLKELRQTGKEKYCRDKFESRFQIIEGEDVNKIKEFRKSCREFIKGGDINGKFKNSRFDNVDKGSGFYRIDAPRQGYQSILQPLSKDGNYPIVQNKKSSEFEVQKDENGYITIQNEDRISSDTEKNITLNNLADRGIDKVWIPLVYYNNTNILTNKKYFDSNVYENAARFLIAFLYSQGVNLQFNYEQDCIFHVQKAVLYAIGAYLYSEDYDFISKNTSAVLKTFVPDFLEEKDKTHLKGLFISWTQTFTKKILRKIQDGSTDGTYNISYRGSKMQSASLKDKELQKELIDLFNEDCFIISFPKKHEQVNKKDPLLSIDKDYIQRIYAFIKDGYEKENSNKGTEEDRTITAVPINGSDENLKCSLYYTLKNLYDRWLSIYSHDNFKLDRPGVKRNNNSDVYSEFNNFMYVDSFYKDISSDFMVNPKSLFNIVNEQIMGNTNFNVLEFIGKICQDNKLLFRCLPVYNNLYSAETFKDIFRPLSLYNGADKLHRRIGNTYLIMYPYEPSNKLNLLQDKTNDVAFYNDSFDFGDSFGNVTDEASKLFKEGDGENICAFGVTPGAQNQSYFTRVSVGMDNPRVTDFAIQNKFMLAQNSGIGGRPEAAGTGQDLFSIYSNRSYDCNVEMLGCANIMPMMYFQLNNVPMFKGAYMITKVEHNIQNNTMATKFTGTRMSKYYIPFNKAIFNIQELYDIVNKCRTDLLNNKQINLYYTESTIPVPEEGSQNNVFNKWAAVNQMAQCFKNSKDSRYVPLNSTYSQKVEWCYVNKGLCATAVEMFLMAGFYGVFGANDLSEGMSIDKYRYKLKVNGHYFYGKNGYDMKDRLSDFGFAPIASGASQIDKMAEEHKFLPGDVCVMMYKDPSSVGHVCMYSGEYWVSDFLQKNSGWRERDKSSSKVDTSNDASVILYRYPNTENKKQVFCYFKDGKIVENFKNDKGYVDSVEGMLKTENVVDL